MGWFEALILGLVQGLTEYLPVSSSGHLEIGQYVLSRWFDYTTSGEENLMFAVLVHVATVLSTVVILWKEIVGLLKGICTSTAWNSEKIYAAKIIVSMIPVFIVGMFFKDEVEAFFGNGLLLVGCCLLVTAALLAFSYYAKPRVKTEISYIDAFVIGIAQAIAVLPGLSRSGSTIATGLLLGDKKEEVAKFSFLMVIVPILGEAFLDALKMVKGEVSASADVAPLLVGFIAAFVSGCLACKFMLNIVRKGKLVWFAIYCLVVGLIAIAFGL